MNLSSVLTKAKTYVAQNGDKIERGIDKVATTVDTRTKGQHRSKIDQGTAKLKQVVRSQGGRGGFPPGSARGPA